MCAASPPPGVWSQGERGLCARVNCMKNCQFCIGNVRESPCLSGTVPADSRPVQWPFNHRCAREIVCGAVWWPMGQEYSSRLVRGEDAEGEGAAKARPGEETLPSGRGSSVPGYAAQAPRVMVSGTSDYECRFCVCATWVPNEVMVRLCVCGHPTIHHSLRKDKPPSSVRDPREWPSKSITFQPKPRRADPW